MENAQRARSHKWQALALRASLFLCLCCLLSAGALTGWYFVDKSRSEDRARALAEETATHAAEQIERTIGKALIAQVIADDLTSGRLRDDQVEARLIQELEANPAIGAFTVAYSPQFVPQGRGSRYCPYSERDEQGDVVIYRVEEKYDYTQPDGTIGPNGEPIRTQWYHQPLKQGPTWTDAYPGESGRTWWGGFGTPFYRTDPATGERLAAGVVDASFTLSGFQELLASVDLGAPGAGYGFIIAEDGSFLSHPIDEYVMEKTGISEFDRSLDMETLRGHAERVEGGQTVATEHFDEKAKRSSWVFLSPIPSCGWWVGIVLDQEHVNRDRVLTGSARGQQVGIVMSSLGFLFFLSVVLSRAYRGTSARLWITSITFSVLCTAGIAYLWVLNISTPSAEDPRDVILVDRAVTRKVVADYARELENPVLVPTGIFVESIDWPTAHEFVFLGYIWQKYSDDLPDWVKPGPGEPGFMLPEEIGALKTVAEVYRHREGDNEVIGWRVRALVRQQFDYSRYPFYRADLRIRMWHKDFNQRVILTPDFASYETTAPHELAGLDEGFVAEGWSVDKAYFTYHESAYKTDFGIPSYVGDSVLPELTFHIGLTRQFLDVFVSRIVPLSVVAVLLFAVLMIGTRSEERVKLSGFSTAAVLAYCAALFFVVMLSHINMRTDLESPESIVYLEYLYFTVYGALLAVSVNSVVFALRVNIRLIEFRDNGLVKQLFWPVYLGVLLVITLLVFL